MQVQITTTPTRIQLERTPPLLNLRRTPPAVAITTQHTEMVIDNSALERQTARLSPQELGRDHAARARAAALEGIARRAGEGRQLGRIDRGESAIAAIARTLPRPSNTQAELTLAMADPPRIRANPGGVQITPQPGRLEGDPRGGQRIDWIPGQVQIDVRA